MHILCLLKSDYSHIDCRPRSLSIDAAHAGDNQMLMSPSVCENARADGYVCYLGLNAQALLTGPCEPAKLDWVHGSGCLVA